MNFLTSEQAGNILGITGRRVRALIKAGRLPAIKHGHVWLIAEKDLEKVAVRKPGRPKWQKSEKGKSLG
jgi:excisionase family DNA binding protein